jgi:hypothetical protein
MEGRGEAVPQAGITDSGGGLVRQIEGETGAHGVAPIINLGEVLLAFPPVMWARREMLLLESANRNFPGMNDWIRAERGGGPSDDPPAAHCWESRRAWSYCGKLTGWRGGVHSQRKIASRGRFPKPLYSMTLMSIGAKRAAGLALGAERLEIEDLPQDL